MRAPLRGGNSCINKPWVDLLDTSSRVSACNRSLSCRISNQKVEIQLKYRDYWSCKRWTSIRDSAHTRISDSKRNDACTEQGFIFNAVSFPLYRHSVNFNTQEHRHIQSCKVEEASGLVKSALHHEFEGIHDATEIGQQCEESYDRLMKEISMLQRK